MEIQNIINNTAVMKCSFKTNQIVSLIKSRKTFKKIWLNYYNFEVQSKIDENSTLYLKITMR